MAAGPNANSKPNSEGPSGKPLPLSVRLLAAGVRGARDVGKATGIDQAIELAAEEAMVAAVESEAVERAIARVLKGPVVEEAMNNALESDAVKSALVEALDSELVDEVWRRLLASDETQRLVERIAEAPEIRAAISAQSVGMIEDVGHTIGNGTRRLDGALERVVRKIFLRKRRTEPTDRAGAVTRGLAFALDALIVNLGFSGLAAVAALIASAFTGNGNGVSNFALAAGTALWFGLGALYLVSFWSLAGQTLGMRFLGIRLDVDGPGLSPSRSIKRLIGMTLATIPFGLGFLGILFDKRRRAWDDRLSGVDVVYEGNERTPAPWSRLAIAEPPLVAEPSTTKAPDSRGLQSQRVAGSSPS
ncbi:MAG TPA: RDD family protein [Solirubrobacterales bacterium]|nr:RDD family protein [Solirubrobacterales bacterium]